jgi:putative aldouronate transport system permease protein
MSTALEKKKTEKQHSRCGKRSYYAELYGMMALPLLKVLLFSYVPMFGLIIAFKDYKFNKGILGSRWVGLKNFDFFLKSNDFLVVTRNTILLNLLFIVAGILAALILAILLYNVTSRKATKVLQTMYITPNFVGWVLVSYLVYAFLNPQYGMLNGFLNSIGLEEVSWYSEPKYWPFILTVVNTWKIVGMDSVIYYAALMGIDESLFEAAKIDGANSSQITRKIMIPEIMSIITILSILKVGNIFKGDFGLFYQVTMNSALLYDVTDVVDTYVYRTMKETNNMSLSTAVGFIQSVVGMIMVVGTNWLSKKIDKDNGLF